ncbi:MAG: PilZ domain-containing protein [Pyrinomonadaceae bacterium]
MIIRQLVARLHCLIIDRRSAPRRRFSVPVTIIIPPEKNPSANLLKPETFSITGETKDFSEDGIAFYVSAIRLREHYLVGENRPLIAELDLPEGRIKMKIVGVRYERENGNSPELKYLIGARISEIPPTEKEIYRRFLRHKNGWKKETIQDFSAEMPES